MKISALSVTLLSAVTATAMAAKDGSDESGKARRLARRYLNENPELAVAFGPSADFDCSWMGAESESACENARAGNCVWCPFGSDLGACVNAEQAKAVNGVEFPHMKCGANENALEDAGFWDDMIGCGMVSTTEDKCLGQGFACAWCETTDPVAAGVCLNAGFMDMVKELEDGEDLPVRVEDVLSCSTESRGSNVEGILDFSCVLYSAFGKTACTRAIDESGNGCVYQMIEEEDMGVCLTPTQNKIFNLVVEVLDEVDIDEFMDSVGQELGFAPEDDGMDYQYDTATTSEMMYDSSNTWDEVEAQQEDTSTYAVEGEEEEYDGEEEEEEYEFESEEDEESGSDEMYVGEGEEEMPIISAKTIRISANGGN